MSPRIDMSGKKVNDRLELILPRWFLNFNFLIVHWTLSAIIPQSNSMKISKCFYGIQKPPKTMNYAPERVTTSQPQNPRTSSLNLWPGQYTTYLAKKSWGWRFPQNIPHDLMTLPLRIRLTWELSGFCRFPWKITPLPSFPKSDFRVGRVGRAKGKQRVIGGSRDRGHEL